jgi:hypothetical protein
VATIHDEAKETIRAHLTLVHVFHTYASTDTLWVAHPLSRCTPVRYGRIASVSTTQEATKFQDFICPVCISTFKCLFIRTQLTRALTDTEKYYKVKILSKGNVRCLPWSREEENLASSKLSVFSKPAGSEPMRCDAWSYLRYKGRDSKSDTAPKL